MGNRAHSNKGVRWPLVPTGECDGPVWTNLEAVSMVTPLGRRVKGGQLVQLTGPGWGPYLERAKGLRLRPLGSWGPQICQGSSWNLRSYNCPSLCTWHPLCRKCSHSLALALGFPPRFSLSHKWLFIKELCQGAGLSLEGSVDKEA